MAEEDAQSIQRRKPLERFRSTSFGAWLARVWLDKPTPPRETTYGRLLRVSIFASLIGLAITYNIGAIAPGVMRSNEDWKLNEQTGWWGFVENFLHTRSGIRWIYTLADDARADFIAATGVRELEFFEQSEIENGETDNISSEGKRKSEEVLRRLSDNIYCAVDEIYSIPRGADTPFEREKFDISGLLSEDLDELEDRLEDCVQSLMLDDVFRVTATNINFVFLLSVLMLVFTFNSNDEVKRKWFDSLYFFGFILTLTALILALSNVARMEDDQLAIIVVQSAIALSSTVVALICRVVLLQLRVPAVDDDEEAQLSQLNLALERLTQNLELAGVKVTTFTSHVDDTSSGIKGAGKTFRDEVTSVSDALGSKVDEISKLKLDENLIVNQMKAAVKGALDQVKPEIEDLRKSFRDGSGQVEEAIVRLDTAIGGIQTSLTGLSDTATTSSTEITIAVKEVVTASASSLEALSQNASTMAERLAGLDLAGIVSNRLSAMLDQISSEMAKEQQRLSGAVTAILGQFEISQDGQKRIAQQTEILSQRIEAQNAGLARLSETFAELDKRVVGTFADPNWVANHAAKIEALSASNSSLLAAIATLDSTLQKQSPAPKRRRWWRPFW